MNSLRTERLECRQFRPQDARAAHGLFDLDAEVWQFNPGRPQTLEQRTEMLPRHIDAFAHDGLGLWAVTDHATGNLVGYRGLRLFYLPGVPRGSFECELYFKLGRTYWGRGLATEAGLAIVTDAFDRLRMPRLMSFADRQNTRAIAVMRRLNMCVQDSPQLHGDVFGVRNNPP